jgi:hypothetical protein
VWATVPRELKRGCVVSLPLLLAALVVPALVASQTVKPNFVTVLLAFFLYLRLWLEPATTAARAAAILYGIPVKRILIESDETFLKRAPSRAMAHALYSFGLTVYGFAIGYVFLSNFRPASFNVGKLKMFSGLYFSLTTIATVGYGDIVPITTLARLLVMCEICTGMLYAIFIFSIIASFVRERSRN